MATITITTLVTRHCEDGQERPQDMESGDGLTMLLKNSFIA
jgi:hypothetical protein